eukprot:COSAG02_NODE_15834_length_1138_cov_1.043311_1_plen_86_part_10
MDLKQTKFDALKSKEFQSIYEIMIEPHRHKDLRVAGFEFRDVVDRRARNSRRYQHGEHASRPAFDSLLQAAGGLISVTGPAAGPEN